MLDVRRLTVLRAVVTSGSVTAAAAHLGYTPSAISQQVAALEKQAGVALLERVGRGVRPTAAGQLLAEHAAVIGGQVAAAETALADLREGRTGRLAIRYFTTVGSSVVAPALARLREEFPGVRIDLRMNDPDDPLSEVTQGHADLAIVISPHGRTYDGVCLVHLLDDAYRVVLPKGHRLESKRVIDLGDLADESWVGSELSGACLDTVIDACAAAGFSPDFVVESGDYATAQGFVAAGLGVSLVPNMGLLSHHPGVMVRKVRNPEPVRAIHAAVREASLGQLAMQGLIRALKAAAAR
ncbi:LysR family transcriptional regulator [Streptomyces sp. NBC_00820]|uniref:LysR family transcriptional regulator n=1 Tax=Streptomyces sp. NBC_00820 TaxID=2975842 RepID=UPI002ED51DA0|nr:LysR family transcriptional regulator [Streptomyces sp. NBC_00820]